MPTTEEKTILATPEDWDGWIEHLHAEVDKEIWSIIDPDDSDEPEHQLEKPRKPQITDFQEDATALQQLTPANRKIYDNSRRYYAEDLKEYKSQRKDLQTARSWIRNHVSKSKAILLDPTDSTYEWLVKLKEESKPSDQFMESKVENQYTEALKGFKMTKLDQWLDRWEGVMKLVVKHDLPQASKGRWLRDLSRVVRPVNESYSSKYMSQSRDTKQGDVARFHQVAMEIRQDFPEFTKKGPSTGTMRGSAFNADFAGETEDGNVADVDTPADNKGPSRKRAGTTSIEEDAPEKKKPKKSTCPACGRKGHNLPDCWYLFEDKRPERFKVSEKRLKETLERVKNNKDLSVRVQKLRLERGEAVEVDEA